MIKLQKLLENSKNLFTENTSNGDCYEANGREFLNNTDYDYLVHGEVQGQGPISNITFGHAWLEKGNTVYDFSNNRKLEIPKDVYYAIGHIDSINNIYKYDKPEFHKKLSEHEHWGPWDLETKY